MASTPTQDLQNEVLNTVRKSQESVIDAIKTWVETVQSITPKVPAVDMPFADKLPKPEEVVASAYDFAEQLLASQRKFAEEVLKATSALTPGTEEQHQVSKVSTSTSQYAPAPVRRGWRVLYLAASQRRRRHDGPVGSAAGGTRRLHPRAAQARQPVAAPARRADQPVQPVPQPGRAGPAPASVRVLKAIPARSTFPRKR
jgi:hypothetical protein